MSDRLAHSDSGAAPHRQRRGSRSRGDRGGGEGAVVRKLSAFSASRSPPWDRLAHDLKHDLRYRHPTGHRHVPHGVRASSVVRRPVRGVRIVEEPVLRRRRDNLRARGHEELDRVTVVDAASSVNLTKHENSGGGVTHRLAGVLADLGGAAAIDEAGKTGREGDDARAGRHGGAHTRLWSRWATGRRSAAVAATSARPGAEEGPAPGE